MLPAPPSSQAIDRRSPSTVRDNVDEVHVIINTTLLIKPYSRYYSNIPIDDFVPEYHALTDGSLISSALINDLRSAYISLIICAGVLVVFIINLVRCWGFVRRGKIQKKMLLYLVLISQLLGPVGLLPLVFAYLYQDINCTVVGYLISLCSSFSLSLLITGTFGIKAYRCLEKSRVVMIVLGATRGGALVILGLLLPTLNAGRRLSGSCRIALDQQLSFIYIILQLLESLFIFGCFFFAVYKSHGQPSVRGRISLRLSIGDYDIDSSPIEDLEGSVFGDENAVASSLSVHSDTLQSPIPRGWWDYVPEHTTLTDPVPLPHPQPLHPVSRFLHWLRTLTLSQRDRDPPRKPNLTGDAPVRQPPPPRRYRMAPFKEPLDPGARLSTGVYTSRYPYWRRRLGLTSSSRSTLGRLMPQMVLFKAVMRDELLYTTFMAMSCVIVAILSTIGLKFPLTIGASSWVLINWMLVSSLTVHSFSRVVRRHEQEALLRQPATWEVPPITVHAPARSSAHPTFSESSRRWTSTPISVTSSHHSHNRRREKDGEEFEME